MSWDINHFLCNNNNVFIVIGFVGAVVVAEDAITPGAGSSVSVVHCFPGFKEEFLGVGVQ